jgi:hypothetical protein
MDNEQNSGMRDDLNKYQSKVAIRIKQNRRNLSCFDLRLLGIKVLSLARRED